MYSRRRCLSKAEILLIENSEKILEQFPNATSFTISGCGHWVHAEKPEFVIRAIERFVNKN